MRAHHLRAWGSISLVILVFVLACNLGTALSPRLAPTVTAQVIAPTVPVAAPSATTEPAATSTLSINHVAFPSNTLGSGQLVYDVESEDYAAERRAPYGDSYDINRLERPFQQDMTYVPDLDISTYTVSGDNAWWYVTTRLIGGNPNNELGINYGVELDLDHDGFGDYLIWSHPPYSTTWATSPVQIFQDRNHDTGGLSAEKSDAPITTDGYETLIFDGAAGAADPDIAWVRVTSGMPSTVQFAFKKSWSGVVFMLGVLADAGFKDPRMLDYVDRHTAAEAGSPVRDNVNYPLKALFAVDNACREAFGFKATGYEPQLCPHEAPPATRKPKTPIPPPPSGCQDPGDCPYGWAGEPFCYCLPG